MKKLLLSTLIVIFELACFGQNVTHAINPKAAYKFLNRTNKIIFLSLKEVQPIQVYTGGYATGKEMQKKAIKEFKNRKYQKAVNDSYVARRLAFRAYKANSKKPIPENWKLTPKEQLLITVKVTPQMLNKLIKHEYISREQRQDFNVKIDDLNEEDLPAEEEEIEVD